MKNRRNYNNSEVQKNVRFVRISTASPAVESNCIYVVLHSSLFHPGESKKGQVEKTLLSKPTNVSNH